MNDERNRDSQNPDKAEGSVLNDLFNAVGLQPGKKPPGKRGRKLFMGALLLGALAAGAYVIPRAFEPKPPDPEAVATYNGKNIMVSQLNDFITMEGTRNQEHMICDTHGYDHSECSSEESCERHPIDSLEEYRQAVQMMAVEQIILEWADSQGITDREEVQHGIKDLVGDESVKELLYQIHQEKITPDSISKWEVQQYYDENRDTFKDRGLTEAEEEIREILLIRKDEEYIPDYISRLKESAGLQVDFELLRFSEPTSGEIQEYYQKNLDQYQKTKPEAETQTFAEAEAEIRETLSRQAMDQQYTLKKDEALFKVHGKRYTLGDFYTEFKELPLEYQKTLSSFDNKKELVEQLIAKELLLEETGDKSGEADKQHELEELKIQYISQVMHQEEVDEKLEEVTEEEKKEYYDKNESQFKVPARIKLSLIWIKLTEEQKDQAWQKAKEALKLIDEGTDFSQAARQYSEDGTGQAGGEMEDWFYQGHLAQELDSGLFSIKPGEVSRIIESQGGLYIVKVREKEESRISTFEESAEAIAAHIKEQKHAGLEQQMEKKILEEAKLVIYNRTLRSLLKERDS